MQTNVIAIVGPTAVGKTAVAIELVRSIGGEIVSADSMAVYTGMDVGTAKPDYREQQMAKFHLIDVADPGQPFSVGDFQRLAHAAVDDILERNPPAVVVGGSGLYVRAAIDGLSLDMPGEDPVLRARLTEEAGKYGNEHVHKMLEKVDPVSAERIHANNLKRVVRALEIYELTGTPASAHFEQDSRRGTRYPEAGFFGLTMERKTLYQRIERRVDSMIDAGLVEEVRRLLDNGVRPDLPSMQGLGYKEIAGFIRGNYGLDEAVDMLKKNTRRFAKRQYTWFRADPRIKWIDVDDMTATEVSENIKESLLNEQNSGKPAG